MRNTSTDLRRQTMYSVFVRNHTEEGTFAALEKDLDRIRALGTDVIWLMPIHPIGQKERKGDLGSPYAIADYRKINPEFGTMEDFEHLVREIHRRDMKCIIDVVYNHTSPDSWLVENHPEWCYRKPDGKMGNKTAEWTDIVDLDYSHPELWDYQIETLCFWANYIDGFRCDVAPLVPLDFWLKARAAVEQVRPGCIWLSESVEPEFILDNRNRGFYAASDCEVYSAFDLCYDYDIRGKYDAYLQGQIPLSVYTDAIWQQEAIYPANYVKLRNLENHDRQRAKALIPDQKMLRNWTAFYFLLKGMPLIYGGQEVCSDHRPDLFVKDTVNWNTGLSITPLLQKLCALKKEEIFGTGIFEMEADDAADLVSIRWSLGSQTIAGVFSLKGKQGEAAIGLPDGEYRNLLDDSTVTVKNKKAETTGEPLVLRV